MPLPARTWRIRRSLSGSGTSDLRYAREVPRVRSYPQDTLERLLTIRRENVIDASQPLVLIAQPIRSGGTLLSRCFDGHPELHVHPAELQIGRGLALARPHRSAEGVG